MLVPSKRIEQKPSQSLRPKRLVILGSTGSIGRSALEIVRANPEKFEVLALCGGNNAELLASQIAEFHPKFAALIEEPAAAELRKKIRSGTEILSGAEAIAELAALPESDMVLAAIVGVAGLRGVERAVRAGKQIALANKESLVAGGALLAGLCKEYGSELIPVDSEHSAIFQALQGSISCDIEKLILTASGGPFLKRSLLELSSITPEQAVKHPNWSMGAKISIDSATMVNKALELIEACWLFGVPEDRVEVIIHPQSIIHSLVEFCDGTQVAQLSWPDMKGAISYALNYPDGRVPGVVKPIRLDQVGSLEFLPLDNARFPAVALARSCLRQGGSATALFNSLNELAVQLFMDGRISFAQIVSFIERGLDIVKVEPARSIQELCELHEQVKLKAELVLAEF